MSRFFSERFASLVPYVPGEQPKDMKYIKLNTNESPFPPAPEVADAVAGTVDTLCLYPDPECTRLKEKLARLCGVGIENVFVSNGSDEALDMAFAAFCSDDVPALFADVTYGFYSVFARHNNVPYEEIPLKDDLTVDIDDYIIRKGTVFIANPNAPTGLALPVSELERLVSSNTSRVVVVDEAYVDFGGESAIPLCAKYDNLLIIQTFSKSRSMAGARIGFAVGDSSLIADLDKLKYSANPFNVNAMSAKAAEAALDNDEYTRANCRTVCENREYTSARLREMGFEVTDSMTNFVFARHPDVSGKLIYKKLRENGILIRRFDIPRISDHIRITIGHKWQMDALLECVKRILEEENA